MNPKKPKKGEVPQKPTRLAITVAATYPVWQQSVVAIMSQNYSSETRTFADERTLLEAFKGNEAIKKQMKRVMTFVATIKVNVAFASAVGEPSHSHANPRRGNASTLLLWRIGRCRSGPAPAARLA